MAEWRDDDPEEQVESLADTEAEVSEMEKAAESLADTDAQLSTVLRDEVNDDS